MFKTDDVIVYMANAGTGKTTALMNELEKALKLYRPDEVAFVSFSRQANRESLKRAKDYAENFDENNYPFFKTLHAMTYMVNNYGEQGKRIVSRDDAKHFGTVTRFKFDINSRTEGQTHPRNTLGQICFDWYSLTRSGGKHPTPKELPEQRSYREFIELYEEFKKVNNLIDYQDCLEDYLNVGKPVSQIKFALIDEAQDLTLQQWEVCYKLFEDAVSIRIAGDDLQCIYKYQGASPARLIEHAAINPVKKLEKSYRLPVKVAKFANVIASKIVEKVDKKTKTVKKDDGHIQFYDSMENFYYALEARIDEQWYILTRANYQIRDVTDYLKTKLVLFHYSTGFCIPQKELEKIRQYYQWSANIKGFDNKFCYRHKITPDADGNWKKWYDTGLVNVKWRQLIRDYEKKYGFDKLWEMTFKHSNITVTTVFKVKGGEADNVAILTDTTRKIEAARYSDNDNELRILYTAVTRTKKNLYFFSQRSEFTMLNRIKYLYKEVK
jgi:superfamily I DNA/RNA helicase